MSSAANAVTVERVGSRSSVVIDVRQLTELGLRAMLTAGVSQIIEHMVAEAERVGSRGIVVLDLRTDATGVRPDAAALIEAVRGLAQSFVLERGADGPSVNVMVTDRAADEQRAATVRFLESDAAVFARGATYDLRGETRW